MAYLVGSGEILEIRGIGIWIIKEVVRQNQIGLDFKKGGKHRKINHKKRCPVLKPGTFLNRRRVA
ncbi:MAG TPA: hypothetical protein PLG66_13570, partial [Calditrichia bacterium]|nr:hypothetical protein [Calditrichia bacterium]